MHTQTQTQISQYLASTNIPQFEGTLRREKQSVSGQWQQVAGIELFIC